MRFTVLHAGLSLALLVGCAGPVRDGPLGPDHPASPSAAEAPLPPPSQTLAVDTSAAPGTPGVASPQAPHPAGHAASQPAGALYACPMHPEVTSTNPNDRCPKCGMMINKPVKSAATAPAAPAATSSDGNPLAPHQHDHGGGNK